MPFHIHHPRPPLDAFVRVMCVCEDYRPLHGLEKILPDGSMTMVIRLDADELRIYEPSDTGRFSSVKGSLLSGPQSTFHVIDTQCQKSIMTVHFKPGRAFPFLGLPADELQNQQAALADVWAHEAGELREQLVAARLPSERFALMEAVLLRRLRHGPVPSRAVQFALRRLSRGPQDSRMADLARDIGLSQRHFIRLFRAEVGLAPKTFVRVMRFHETLKQLQRDAEPDWADVAIDCGFYDQAHFIHEFQTFCGMSPARYAASRGEHLLHLPMR